MFNSSSISLFQDSTSVLFHDSQFQITNSSHTGPLCSPSVHLLPETSSFITVPLRTLSLKAHFHLIGQLPKVCRGAVSLHDVGVLCSSGRSETRALLTGFTFIWHRIYEEKMKKSTIGLLYCLESMDSNLFISSSFSLSALLFFSHLLFLLSYFTDRGCQGNWH